VATPREIILRLNSLAIGDFDLLRSRLDAARQDLLGLGHADLAASLDEAQRNLSEGKTSEYRRLVSQVVSRLGHLARG